MQKHVNLQKKARFKFTLLAFKFELRLQQLFWFIRSRKSLKEFTYFVERLLSHSCQFFLEFFMWKSIWMFIKWNFKPNSFRVQIFLLLVNYITLLVSLYFYLFTFSIFYQFFMWRSIWMFIKWNFKPNTWQNFKENISS